MIGDNPVLLVDNEPVDFVGQIKLRVPRTAWETLSPIMYETVLRENDNVPFLGSGYIFDQLLMTDGRCLGKPRDPGWEKASKNFLYGKVCAVCSGKSRLVTHHMKSFHDHPELEMVASNWIPLCEGRFSCNCHLTFGHMGNWKLINPQVIPMSQEYLLRWNQARSS